MTNANSRSPVCEQVIDHFSLFRSDACSMSPVAAIFCPVYTCALKASFKPSSQRTGYRQLNTLHFLALIVVDSIKLSTENSHRKQLASSVEALIASVNKRLDFLKVRFYSRLCCLSATLSLIKIDVAASLTLRMP